MQRWEAQNKYIKGGFQHTMTRVNYLFDWKYKSHSSLSVQSIPHTMLSIACTGCAIKYVHYRHPRLLVHAGCCEQRAQAAGTQRGSKWINDNMQPDSLLWALCPNASGFKLSVLYHARWLTIDVGAINHKPTIEPVCAENAGWRYSERQQSVLPVL